jgi:hypothetical protein
MAQAYTWALRAVPCGHGQPWRVVDDPLVQLVITWPAGSSPICALCDQPLHGFVIAGTPLAAPEEAGESPPDGARGEGGEG